MNMEATEIKKKKQGVAALLIIIAAAAVVVLGLYFYLHQQALQRERNGLTAVGSVEATKVMASFKVAGRIDKILVDEGARVEKGQELASLETREIDAQLAQAQGAYEAAQGQAGEAQTSIGLTSTTVEAKIAQAQGVLDKALVELTDTRQDYERAKSLHDSGGASDSTLDKAQNAMDAAQRDVDTARGQLNEALAARQEVAVAEKTYQAAAGLSQQSQGKVAEVQSYVDNTHLKSPTAGFITQKNLEAGEIVSAGTPVFEITDLEHTYVKVFIDEDKIGRVHLGQSAQVKVDSFPGRVFNGKVVWINDAGQFAVRKAISEQYSHDIRSFEVKIDVPNSDLLLKTGMTATVTILEKE